MNMLSGDPNKQFLEKSIKILSWGGGITLCLHLLSWGITGHSFYLLNLPLWGTAQMNTVYPAINFAITAAAIGYSLSLYNRVGWLVAIFLLGLQGILFTVLMFYLVSDMWKIHLYSDLQQVGIAPLIESLILNLCLLILVSAGILYLCLPSIKKLFWEE